MQSIMSTSAIVTVAVIALLLVNLNSTDASALRSGQLQSSGPPDSYSTRNTAKKTGFLELESFSLEADPALFGATISKNISRGYDSLISSVDNLNLHLSDYSALGNGSTPLLFVSAVLSSSPPSMVLADSHRSSSSKGYGVGLGNPLNLHLQDGGGFTCAPPPSPMDVSTMCAGVVDYDYVLPDGQSATDMNNYAIGAAAGLSNFINSACLSDLKRLLCANVYLPCAPGIDPSDASTYPLLWGFVPFPYKRPCENLCSATLYTGTSCMGLLEGLGAAPNCTEIDPLTTLPRYDSTNDPAWCNDLASTAGMQVVASKSEPYLGQVCSGIITEYLVPEPASISPYFAPLQPPFVLQFASEFGLSSVMATVPKFLFPECQSAMLEMYCSLSFMQPHSSDQLSFVFGTVYYPNFPAKEVCTNFNDKCSALIEATPSLAMNCDTEISPGVKLFPATDQTLFSLDLGWGPIDFVTSPFNLEVTRQFQSECPFGFAPLPDKVNENMYLVGIPYINCGFTCPLAIYTDAELKDVVSVSLPIYFLTVVMVLISFLNLLYATKNPNIFMVVMLSSMLIQYFLPIIAFMFNGYDYDKMTCSSEMEWLSIEDGTTSSNLCAFTAIVNECVQSVNYWLVLAVSSELWFKVCMSVKDVTFLRYFYFYGSAALILGNVILILTDKGSKMVSVGGFSAATEGGICVWSLDSSLEKAGAKSDRFFWLVMLPHVTYFSFAIVVSIHLLYKCIMISLSVAKEGENAFLKIWSTYRLLFLLLCLALAIFPVIISIEVNRIAITKPIVDSVVDWVVCFFANFVTSSDTSYVDVCSRFPELRSPPSSFFAKIYVFILYSVIMVFITLSPAVRKFWIDKLFDGKGCESFDRILDKLGDFIRRFLGMESHKKNEAAVGKGALTKPSSQPVPVTNNNVSLSKISPIASDVDSEKANTQTLDSKTVEMKLKYKESPPSIASSSSSSSSAIPLSHITAPNGQGSDASIIQRFQMGVDEIVDAIKTTSASAAAVIGIGEGNFHFPVPQNDLLPDTAIGTPASESVFIDENVEA